MRRMPRRPLPWRRRRRRPHRSNQARRQGGLGPLFVFHRGKRATLRLAPDPTVASHAHATALYSRGAYAFDGRSPACAVAPEAEGKRMPAPSTLLATPHDSSALSRTRVAPKSELPVYTRLIHPRKGLWRRRWLDLMLRLTVKRSAVSGRSIREIRLRQARMDERFGRVDRGTRRTAENCAGVRAEW